jgi:hypothetical protein
MCSPKSIVRQNRATPRIRALCREHRGRALQRYKRLRIGERLFGSADELEKATRNSGAVAQNIGDTDRAMASAVTKVEATYQLPFLA